jgi:hypothetical protein
VLVGLALDLAAWARISATGGGGDTGTGGGIAAIWADDVADGGACSAFGVLGGLAFGEQAANSKAARAPTNGRIRLCDMRMGITSKNGQC